MINRLVGECCTTTTITESIKDSVLANWVFATVLTTILIME